MLVLHLTRAQNDIWGMLFVLALIFLSTRWGRSGRREGWRQNVDAMRARAEQRQDEQRAFQDQLLAEMRRQTAAAEQQSVLLRQLIDQRQTSEAAAQPTVE